MRFASRPLSCLLWIAAILLCSAACDLRATEDPDTIYYAIEINGALCGYSTLRASPSTVDDRPVTVVEQEVFAMVSVLGSQFNTEISGRYVIDDATERFVEAESEIRQGPTKHQIAVHVEEDVAHVESSLWPGDKAVQLDPGVIFEDPMFMPHLVRDFLRTDTEEKSYDVFQMLEGEVQPMRYTRAARESLKLGSTTYDTVVLDAVNLVSAVKLRMWFDVASERVVRVTPPGGRNIYLSDSSIVKRIEVVNLDETITAKVGVSIPDIRSISYMKVRARIDPIGLNVTPESLNVPGQKFTGTVENNLVDGLFEIEHPAYDGTDAPPFPPDFAGDEILRPYLEPSPLIESGDPLLIDEAQRITRGSRDAWEAAQRLGEWVANEIDYAIPGGGTARRTYDVRAGECGSHSNLMAALSRAAGIPARVVWGCMYIPNFGGAFGQHAWNEVYMGPAGWVPLDATAFETSHLDSGHIRIGVHETLSTALNPIEMEVLDYRGADEFAPLADELASRYRPYTGFYTNVENKRSVELRVQHGGLVVAIPGQVVLPLDDPGEDDVWACKLTNRVFVTFEASENESATAMKLHELIHLRKNSSPATVEESVPHELRKYLGKYLLAALNAEFTVLYHEGGLAVHDPTRDATVGLRSPGADGGWLDEFGKNTIYFELDDEGAVTQLTIDSVASFRRS